MGRDRVLVPRHRPRRIQRRESGPNLFVDFCFLDSALREAGVGCQVSGVRKGADMKLPDSVPETAQNGKRLRSSFGIALLESKWVSLRLESRAGRPSVAV